MPFQRGDFFRMRLILGGLQATFLKGPTCKSRREILSRSQIPTLRSGEYGDELGGADWSDEGAFNEIRLAGPD